MTFMVKLQATKSPRAIVFRVELDGVDPCIWREFQVPFDLSLSDLHDVLQVVLGWTNSHLHEFVIRGEHYMEDFDSHDYEDPDDTPPKDEYAAKLSGLSLRAKSHFRYIYDFGDDWQHTLRVLRIIELVDNKPYVFIGGERNCPPEDCGSVPGYQHILELLAKTPRGAAQSTPEEDDEDAGSDDPEILEWVGDYDPASFDVGEIEKTFVELNTFWVKNHRARKTGL